jgi:hypothetical protein
MQIRRDAGERARTAYENDEKGENRGWRGRVKNSRHTKKFSCSKNGNEACKRGLKFVDAGKEMKAK